MAEQLLCVCSREQGRRRGCFKQLDGIEQQVGTRHCRQARVLHQLQQCTTGRFGLFWCLSQEIQDINMHSVFLTNLDVSIFDH